MVATWFKGWTVFEKIWLASAVLILVILELIWRDQWVGFVSALSGITCVVLAAKGKLSTYYFGLINAVTYALVAYGYQLYGEAMLNAFFYLPTQFIGFALWFRARKRAEEKVNGEDIFARRLTLKQWLIGSPLVVAATVGYIFFLANLNAAQIHLDGVAVVLSITAQILMLLRFAEQWILWIVVNSVTIVLWASTLITTGGNDWAVLVMWIAYLVNSVYGYINWRKLSATHANAKAPAQAAVLADAKLVAEGV